MHFTADKVDKTCISVVNPGSLSSDARQPEVSLFLNMPRRPRQNQICIATCFLLLKRRFAPKFVKNHRLKCAESLLNG